MGRLPMEALSHNAFRVAMALAYFTDNEGLCYAAAKKLQKKSGLAHRAVFKGLRELEDGKWIVRRSRGHVVRDPVKDRKAPPGGFQATNYYQLLWVNPVNQLADDTDAATTVQRMPGTGRATVALPVDAEVGPIEQAGRARSSTDDIALRSSHVSSAPDGALDPKWQGILRDLAHGYLSAVPPWSGLELADAVKADAQRFSIGASITDDHIGAAIEQALHQRRAAAEMRRPHHQQKRRRA